MGGSLTKLRGNHAFCVGGDKLIFFTGACANRVYFLKQMDCVITGVRWQPMTGVLYKQVARVLAHVLAHAVLYCFSLVNIKIKFTY